MSPWSVGLQNFWPQQSQALSSIPVTVGQQLSLGDKLCQGLQSPTPSPEVDRRMEVSSQCWNVGCHADSELISPAATLPHCSRIWGDRIHIWEHFCRLSSKQEPAQERTIGENPKFSYLCSKASAYTFLDEWPPQAPGDLPVVGRLSGFSL